MNIATHPNGQLLQTFYTAFASRDHAAMQACYESEAEFADEVFTLKGKEVGAMWHMLVEAGDAAGRDHWDPRRPWR